MNTTREPSPTDWLMSLLSDQLPVPETNYVPDYMTDTMYQEASSINNGLTVSNGLDSSVSATPVPIFVSEQMLPEKEPNISWFEDESNDSHHEYLKLNCSKPYQRIYLEKQPNLSWFEDSSNKYNQRIEKTVVKDYVPDSATWNLQPSSSKSSIVQNDLNSAVDLQESKQFHTASSETSNIVSYIPQQHSSIQLNVLDPTLSPSEVSSKSLIQPLTIMKTAKLEEVTKYQSQSQLKAEIKKKLKLKKPKKKEEEHEGHIDSKLQNEKFSSKVNSVPDVTGRSNEKSEAEKKCLSEIETIKDSDEKNERSQRYNHKRKISSQTHQAATTKPKTELICFYEDEFLAVRNESDTFYICKALQDIYRSTRKFKIKWLAQLEKTPDIYVLEFDDVTEFGCILTSLNLIKVTEQHYKLPLKEYHRIKNILQRSIDVGNGVIDSSQLHISEEHPDGLDLSVYYDEEQLNKRESVSSNSSKFPDSTSSKSETVVSKSREVWQFPSLNKPTSSKKVPEANILKQPGVTHKQKSKTTANKSSAAATVALSPEKKLRQDHLTFKSKILNAVYFKRRSPSNTNKK